MPTDGVSDITLGPLVCPPGKRTDGWLPVGQTWRRRDEDIPITVVHGQEPGPILYLQAVSDGDELNGLAVARRVAAELRPDRLRGAVLVTLVANPGALAARQACDPRDHLKLNRCFPGQPDGSVTERLAHLLFHELVLHSDHVIDLHQNSAAAMIPEVRVRTGRRGPRHAESLELAIAFGLPHVLDQQGPPGQLARAAPAVGIPTIDPELGGGPGVEPAMVELGVRGVRNVLRHLGMIDGKPPINQPFIARRLTPVYAPVGGVIAFTARLGQPLRAGEPLGTISDLFGHDPVVVPAPADGVFWLQRSHPLVERGDSVAAIGVAADG